MANLKLEAASPNALLFRLLAELEPTSTSTSSLSYSLSGGPLGALQHMLVARKVEVGAVGVGIIGVGGSG